MKTIESFSCETNGIHFSQASRGKSTKERKFPLTLETIERVPEDRQNSVPYESCEYPRGSYYRQEDKTKTREYKHKKTIHPPRKRDHVSRKRKRHGLDAHYGIVYNPLFIVVILQHGPKRIAVLQLSRARTHFGKLSKAMEALSLSQLFEGARACRLLHKQMVPVARQLHAMRKRGRKSYVQRHGVSTTAIGAIH